MATHEMNELQRQVMATASAEAKALGHNIPGSEHLLLGLLALPGTDDAVAVLNARGLTLDGARSALARIRPPQETTHRPFVFTKTGMQVLLDASVEARRRRTAVDSMLQLRALATKPDDTLIELLHELGTSPTDLLEHLPAPTAETAVATPAGDEAATNEPSGGTAVLEPTNQQQPRNLGKALRNYTTDLTELAQNGELLPVHGRDRETERLIQVLCRRTKNNPVLTGDAGVGKTAIIEGLAQRIVTNNVPTLLATKRILSLDLAAITAGARYRGDLEERIKQLIQEVEADGNLILFLDEIHMLLGAGGSSGSPGIAELLKPALARGGMCPLIGATTRDEYVRYIEKDAALERRFAPVPVAQPTVAATVDILRQLRPAFEKHHHVRYTDQALEAAATLADRYIHDRQLPDKAIDLIDEAGAAASMARMRLEDTSRTLLQRRGEHRQAVREAIDADDFETAANEATAERGLTQALPDGHDVDTLTREHIAEIVVAWTGIPVTAMTEAEVTRLRDLPELLAQRVIGQDHAVTHLASAARRRRAGLADAKRPASFVFAGPTGVGKSELAKAFAEVVYGDADALIQLDMSEFGESHSVARINGAPPGYVGYDDSNPILERIRRRPHSVLLLDEVEKADPTVFDAFLHILEEGKLTDSTGRVISTAQMTIIMTTNLGAADAARTATGFATTQSNDTAAEQATRTALKSYFRPEFLNRIDEIIVFKALGKPELRHIVDTMVARIAEQLTAKAITLVLDDTARDALATAGYSPQYGARPLRRAITNHLENLLTDALLGGTLGAGDTVLVSAGDDPKTQLLQLTTSRVDELPADVSELEHATVA